MTLQGWRIWIQSMEKNCNVHFLKKSSYDMLAENLICYIYIYIYIYIFCPLFTTPAFSWGKKVFIKERKLKGIHLSGSRFERVREFYTFFKKIFPGPLDVNISWPINFFRKYSLPPLILVSYLRFTCNSISG